MITTLTHQGFMTKQCSQLLQTKITLNNEMNDAVVVAAVSTAVKTTICQLKKTSAAMIFTITRS